MTHMRSCLFCILLLAGGVARADVKLPAVFSDHAVLQRDVTIPIWGWAEPNETVTVTLAGQTLTANPGTDGRWEVRLENLAAGGPFTLEVKGTNAITAQDVLIGEVWLGSGQSNMAMTVNRARDPEMERAAANLRRVRMYTETSAAAKTPQKVGAGQWVVCSPETVGRFSATLYFFGRELHRELGIPVGLINSSVGGTPIESWIDADVQRAVPKLKAFFDAVDKAEAGFDAARAKMAYEKALAAWKEAAARAKAQGKPAPRRPRDPLAVRARKGDLGGLFNGKIAPLIPYAIRGALWYQGEANSIPLKAPFYRYQLPLLVKDWRARWGQGDLPFAWVQLPNFTGAGRDWPTVREAMAQTLTLPSTGMAVTLDIGEANDIHPKNKQEVGRRLALWALATVYGRKDVVASGPVYARHEIRGSEVVVTFKHAAGGLKVRGDELEGFEVAGVDGNWVEAQARVEGDRVRVSSLEVKAPAAVRYAWMNNPPARLFNQAGLPAAPFRTASDADRGKESLFDGRSLAGWEVRGGKATYRVEDGAIVGTTVEGSPNTFLCTTKTFGDFDLELEVLCDKGLNSGMQIRSHVYEKDTVLPGEKRTRPKGTVFGYQCEVAAQQTGTSGNFWDEARRKQWLDDFSAKPKARQAFKEGEWNRYRIVAQGDRIRSWVNGVPCADFRDGADATGFIGLQVHGVKPGTGPYQVRWRYIRLREFAPGDRVEP